MPVKNNQRADRAGNRKAGNAPNETPEERKVRVAKELRIKPKTKAMVDKLLDNPKMSQTEAYIQTHDTENRLNAGIAASKLLKQPNVMIYKDSAIRKAKKRVVSLVDSENENISLKASQDILDRTEGKAAQKTEHTSRVVRVEVDLTGVKLGNHYLPTGVDLIQAT